MDQLDTDMHEKQTNLQHIHDTPRKHTFSQIPPTLIINNPTILLPWVEVIQSQTLVSWVPDLTNFSFSVSSTTLLPPCEFLPLSQKNSVLPGIPPSYPIPLPSIGLGLGGEWTYSLTLTLEELFSGKRCRFGIVRSYLTKKTKRVVIEIDIPPGCRPGTRILCRGVGHECRPGVFQDIAFVVEEAPHDHFVRLFDDLIMDVRLPCVDSLRKRGSKVPFTGIDGKSLAVQIDYPRDQQFKGRIVIKGAGMPIRERGRVVGRGNVVVQ